MADCLALLCADLCPPQKHEMCGLAAVSAYLYMKPLEMATHCGLWTPR